MRREPIEGIMTNEHFRQLGMAMFGRRWATETAAGIGISLRHVIRIANNECPVSQRIADEMALLAKQRAAMLADTLAAATGTPAS